MSLGRLFSVSLILAALCLAAFHVLVPGIVRGDLPPFDLRFAGYDLTQAEAYLVHLDAEGLTGAYLGLYRWIDTVFPIAVFGMMGAAIWGFWGRPAPMIAILGSLVAVGYLVADYVENASAGAIVKNGLAELSPDAVYVASSATQGKWVAVLAVIMLVVLGMLITVIRGRD